MNYDDDNPDETLTRRVTRVIAADPVASLPFPIAFRPATVDDYGFVVKSWLASYHGGTPAMRAVPWHRYKREQRAIIRDAIEREDKHGACIVACDPDEPSTLYGFAAGWDDIGVGVVHYAYVTQTRRSVGLARALVRALGQACGRTITTYSHTTVQGLAFTRKLGLRYDPFALMRMIYACDRDVRVQGDAAPNGERRQPSDHAPTRRAAGGA